MSDIRKPQEIADEDLDMQGGEGSVTPVDALVVINDISGSTTDATALNPSRTYSVADAKDQVLLNPSRTYKDLNSKG